MAGLDNGQALTPPMGWNSWNHVHCYDLTEDVVKAAADDLVTTGLRDRGYKYVVIDDCWQAFQRSEDGSLRSHPERFASGIRALADYVHDRGLKIGIYSAPGSRTCAMTWDAYPGVGLGSLGHESPDAEAFAAWEVDYLKYDLCQAEEIDGLDPVAAFETMRDALARTRRPIIYSISEYGLFEPWTWDRPVANLWRTTRDLGPSWASVSEVIESQAGLADHSGRPGGWNDPDMLQIGNGTLTAVESRTHFSFWALLNAPLFLGTDIGKLSSEDLETVSNADVIAINQDFAGQQGIRIRHDAASQVWAKPLSDGGLAVLLYNTSEAELPVATTLSEISGGLGRPAESAGRTVRDLWLQEELGPFTFTDEIALSVKAHGVRMLRVSGEVAA